MKTAKIFEQIKIISGRWMMALDEFTDSQYTHCYLAGKWSAAQLYAHQIEVNETIIANILMCIEGRGELIKGKSKLPIKIIFYLGRLPPIKITVPEGLSSNPSPMEKEDFRNRFKKSITKVYEMLSEINNCNPDIKTKHPRLEYINAYQWLQFMLIHLKHHYRQLEKIRILKENG
jgi:hypothetical protein